MSVIPLELRKRFGYAIREMQEGKMPSRLKWEPLSAVGVPLIYELKGREITGAYRVMVVVLAQGVYLLSAFQKKATDGIKTPQREIELAKERRRLAVECDAAIIAGKPMPRGITTLTRG